MKKQQQKQRIYKTQQREQKPQQRQQQQKQRMSFETKNNVEGGRGGGELLSVDGIKASAPEEAEGLIPEVKGGKIKAVVTEEDTFNVTMDRIEIEHAARCSALDAEICVVEEGNKHLMRSLSLVPGVMDCPTWKGMNLVALDDIAVEVGSSTEAPVSKVVSRQNTGRILLEKRRKFDPLVEFNLRVERERTRREENVREAEEAEKSLRLMAASTAVMVERNRQADFEAEKRRKKTDITNPLRNVRFGGRMRPEQRGFRAFTRTIGMIAFR